MILVTKRQHGAAFLPYRKFMVIRLSIVKSRLKYYNKSYPTNRAVYGNIF